MSKAAGTAWRALAASLTAVVTADTGVAVVVATLPVSFSALYTESAGLRVSSQWVTSDMAATWFLMGAGNKSLHNLLMAVAPQHSSILWFFWHIRFFSFFAASDGKPTKTMLWAFVKSSSGRGPCTSSSLCLHCL